MLMYLTLCTRYAVYGWSSGKGESWHKWTDRSHIWSSS